MPSFDVISKINYPEFDNALANCLREISNRYDFKGLHITIERKDKSVTTNAPDELKLTQVNELLQTHLVRRKVDPRVLEVKSSEGASGGAIRQVSELKEGISQENAKKVIADIKIPSGIISHPVFDAKESSFKVVLEQLSNLFAIKVREQVSTPLRFCLLVGVRFSSVGRCDVVHWRHLRSPHAELLSKHLCHQVHLLRDAHKCHLLHVPRCQLVLELAGLLGRVDVTDLHRVDVAGFLPLLA